MADVRGARRAAEKAARERLAGPLISAVGELGVAIAQQTAAGAGVGTAEQRAHEHMQQAQVEADAMVAEARSQIGVADEQYRKAHEAAVTAGWATAALADMGYDAPATPKPTRARATRQTVDEQDSPPAPANLTDRVQHPGVPGQPGPVRDEVGA